MRATEAKWLSQRVLRLSASPIINLGSSTEAHRRAQPHTQKYPWDPIDAAGLRVVHADLKDGDGVDVSGDIYSEEMQQKIKAIRPAVLLCCNMLEHVERPDDVARICAELCDRVIISVPYSYPFHADPIDTMYRPSPTELASLFPGFTMTEGEIVPDLTMWQSLRQARGAGGAVREILGKVIRMPVVLILRPWRFRRRFHQMLWLFRPYKITCAVFER